jgi:drug/metabolite transporter (DMT)-like permease
MKKQIPGGMLVFLGALFWSLNAPLVKFLQLDPYLMCGLRAIIAGIALSPFIRLRQLKWNGWTVLYVVSYLGLSLTIILALKQTSSAVAIGMQYGAIVWLFLARWIKEKHFDGWGFVPVCVVLGGVVLFMCSGTGGTSTTGNLLALTESVYFACMTVSSKKAAGTNPLGLTSLGNFFTGLVVLLAFPASTATVTQMSGMDWALMLVLGVVQLGCGYAFYNLGVQRVTPQKASLLSLWEMLLGPAWVAIFLGEYPTMPVLIGFAVILIGMLLDALLPHWTKQRT